MKFEIRRETHTFVLTQKQQEDEDLDVADDENAEDESIDQKDIDDI
jgi:hypothetical protein